MCCVNAISPNLHLQNSHAFFAIENIDKTHESIVTIKYRKKECGEDIDVILSMFWIEGR